MIWIIYCDKKKKEQILFHSTVCEAQAGAWLNTWSVKNWLHVVLPAVCFSWHQVRLWNDDRGMTEACGTTELTHSSDAWLTAAQITTHGSSWVVPACGVSSFSAHLTVCVHIIIYIFGPVTFEFLAILHSAERKHILYLLVKNLTRIKKSAHYSFFTVVGTWAVHDGEWRSSKMYKKLCFIWSLLPALSIASHLLAGINIHFWISRWRQIIVLIHCNLLRWSVYFFYISGTRKLAHIVLHSICRVFIIRI